MGRTAQDVKAAGEWYPIPHCPDVLLVVEVWVWEACGASDATHPECDPSRLNRIQFLSGLGWTSIL